jgi:aminoglycoside phosphotransferase (APT) family kinase protein
MSESVLDLRRLNEGHGTDLRVAGRYVGGEVGATRLVDARGRHFVFKDQPAGLAPATTEALRATGYPAPRYAFWGDGYHVQEEVPGAPIATSAMVPRDITRRLLELNEIQADRAVDDDASWPQRVIDSVLEGFSAYMVLATLERSETTRTLLRLCQRAVERHAGTLTSARDVVHWDFTHHNILCTEDRVTGVIDWGGTCSGDRLFDLATLVYYAGDAHSGVTRYIVDSIGLEGLSVYLAHLAIRQSDWSLRHHSPTAAADAVSHALRIARRFP